MTIDFSLQKCYLIQVKYKINIANDTCYTDRYVNLITVLARGIACVFLRVGEEKLCQEINFKE